MVETSFEYSFRLLEVYINLFKISSFFQNIKKLIDFFSGKGVEESRSSFIDFENGQNNIKLSI